MLGATVMRLGYISQVTFQCPAICATQRVTLTKERNIGDTYRFS